MLGGIFLKSSGPLLDSKENEAPISNSYMGPLIMGNCKSKRDDNNDNFHNNNTSQSSDTRDQEIKINFKNIGKTYRQNDTFNENVIESIRAEVSSLLERVEEFQGTTDNDKNYRYLDEMLTRCILKLDHIECNNLSDRSSRKEAVEGVNQAISILERKLAINSDIKKLAANLSETEWNA